MWTSRCISMGGHLVKIESLEKESELNKFIKNEIQNVTDLHHIYIGLQDTIGDNQLTSYRWAVDNSVLSYSSFFPGKPSTNGYKCVVLATAIQPYKWYDVPCHISYWAVCEANVFY